MLNWRGAKKVMMAQIGQEISTITAVTVINPESGEVRPDCDVEISGGYITGITPARPRSESNRTYNGRGAFALPGLIDTHVHSLGFMAETIPGIMDLGWMFRQQGKNLRAYLRSGVTTIRDMGSALKLIRRKSLRAEGTPEMPRILYAGPLFSTRGGYPYYTGDIPGILRVFTGPLRIDIDPSEGEERIKHRVKAVLAAGAHCIKVGYQSTMYDAEHTPIPLIKMAALALIVKHAHALGSRVAIHHTFRKDLQDLLNSGIQFDSLEHLTTDEELSHPEIHTIVDRGIPVSTTLMTYGITLHSNDIEQLLEHDPGRFEFKPTQFFRRICSAIRVGKAPMQTMTKDYLETAPLIMRKNLLKLHEAGARIVFATDSGIISSPGCPAWELEDIVSAGLTPIEALRTATCGAADALGMPALGRVEAGKIADIILLRDNPLQKISAIRDILAVIRGGKLGSDTMRERKG